MENWKKIQGFENYSISDMGRVRRDTPGGNTFVGKILTGGVQKDGYRFVVIRNSEKKAHNLYFHKLVAQHFIPNNLGLPEVDHVNGDKKDNRKINLEWVTSSENSKRAFVKGLRTAKKGTSHVMSKLTEQDVIFIRNQRELHKTPYKILAEKFQVTSVLIGNIVNRKTWAHI